MPIKEIIRMYAGHTNCGPVASQIATGRDYEEIIKAWPGEWSGVSNDKGLLFLPNDTPYDHFTVLEKLGINFRKVSKFEILSGMAEPEKTVMLVHLVDKPKNIWQKFLNFFRGLFIQHWIVLLRANIANDEYTVDWGYWRIDKKGNKIPDIKIFSYEQLSRMLSTGYPYCAYTVDTKTTDKADWYQKMYAKIV